VSVAAEAAAEPTRATAAVATVARHSFIRCS
jgi:hypothetical protein